MPKILGILFLLVLLICGLFSIGIVPLGRAQSGQTVSGIISSDTTWTKANSPYNLVGPVGISQGVTLTIEPGTTVNLNKYYLVVNGTLTAKGTSEDKIQINGIDGSSPSIPLGSSLAISFTYGITINGVGTIENTIINSVRVALFGPAMISNCRIAGFVSLGQSTTLSNSLVSGTIAASGTSKVSNNSVDGHIQAEGGSPIISNNKITKNGNGGAGIEFILTDNIEISGNTVSGFSNGISAGGVGVIENNLIANNENGISISGKVTIQQNTLYENNVAISMGSIPSTVMNNNFLNNTYNIYLSTSVNIDATNNWWGTTDLQAINQTIYDSKNDFNLGTVTFVPFLTASNAQAPSLSISTTTPNSTELAQTPTASASVLVEPSNSAFPIEIGIIVAVAVIVVLALAKVFGAKKNR